METCKDELNKLKKGRKFFAYIWGTCMIFVLQVTAIIKGSNISVYEGIGAITTLTALYLGANAYIKRFENKDK